MHRSIPFPKRTTIAHVPISARFIHNGTNFRSPGKHLATAPATDEIEIMLHVGINVNTRGNTLNLWREFTNLHAARLHRDKILP